MEYAEYRQKKGGYGIRPYVRDNEQVSLLILVKPDMQISRIRLSLLFSYHHYRKQSFTFTIVSDLNSYIDVDTMLSLVVDDRDVDSDVVNALPLCHEYNYSAF